MKKLFISFSGGETSAYMVQWCLANLKDEYEMIIVFANTGEENEETLEFVKKCDEILGFNTVWVECIVDPELGKGVRHRVVDFATASRNGEPFEEMIKKYGISNQSYPHCTRVLKTDPMVSYTKNELGWENYYTAIGIRIDEVDRINPNYEKLKFIYPLAQLKRTTKQEINSYWSDMPFRLELKGYQGNCKACWKKSDRKLYTIALEDEGAFDNMMKWEDKYYGKHPFKPAFYFFRKDRSARQIIEEAQKKEFRLATDDSIDANYQLDMFDEELDVGLGCGESCEPF